MSLAAIAAKLGLAADADADTIVTTIGTLQATTSIATIAAAAGLADTATVEEVAAAVTGLKTDLGNSVPKDVAEPLKEELARLRKDRLGKEVDDLVAAGVVMPAKRDATVAWFDKDEAAAREFFKDMPAVVAAGAKLGDRKPDRTTTTLTADEVAACAAIGMSHEDFLKAKNEEEVA